MAKVSKQSFLKPFEERASCSRIKVTAATVVSHHGNLADITKLLARSFLHILQTYVVGTRWQTSSLSMPQS